MTLRGKDPKLAKPSRPKLVVFGQPGVGKTWTALDFPNCYFIDCEDGASLSHYTDKLKAAGASYLGIEDGANDFDIVLEEVQQLATTDHDRNTLIIDSFTKLFNTAIQCEFDRLTNAGKKTEFGVEKKPAISMTRRLIAWLDKLDMNVILICHEKALWKNGESIGETFDAWDKLGFELNLVLQVTKRGDLRMAKVVKSRFASFTDGELVPWQYEEFVDRFGKDVLEAHAVAVDVATVDQVRQVKELIEMLHVSDGDVVKVMDAAGVSRWEEMPADLIAKKIKSLQAKLKKVGA